MKKQAETIRYKVVMKLSFIKTWIFYFLVSVGFIACSGNNNTNNKEALNAPAAKTTESYYLPVPAGWTTERIPFPIDFAPGIKYKGVEDLRFAKGWGNLQSEEHWCYAFVWWLAGRPVVNAGTLQENLTEYYTGLVQRNVVERKILKENQLPTTAMVKEAPTMAGDVATYTGVVNMLDYMSEMPVALNCMIHVKKCNSNDHTAVLFQVSPAPFEHAVWAQLNNLNTGFDCVN